MLLELYERNKSYLSKSKFRSSFKLDERDLSYIEKIGIENIKLHAKDFITKRLSPAFPVKDGKQTPYKGHPVFKAQHAIGVCCRHCLMNWYKIEMHKQLTEDEINQITEIIIKWIKEKLIYPLGITKRATTIPTINPPTPITVGTTQSEPKLKPETSFNVT